MGDRRAAGLTPALPAALVALAGCADDGAPLALAVEAPPARHAALVPMSRLVWPRRHGETCAFRRDPARALARGHAGWAALEIGLDAVRLDGEVALDLDGGLLPAGGGARLAQALAVPAGALAAAEPACGPWRRELLVAADARAPWHTVRASLEAAGRAGFRDLLLLVDDDSAMLLEDLPPDGPQAVVQLDGRGELRAWAPGGAVAAGPDLPRLLADALGGPPGCGVLLPHGARPWGEVASAADALAGAGARAVYVDRLAGGWPREPARGGPGPARALGPGDAAPVLRLRLPVWAGPGEPGQSCGPLLPPLDPDLRLAEDVDGDPPSPATDCLRVLPRGATERALGLRTLRHERGPLPPAPPVEARVVPPGARTPLGELGAVSAARVPFLDAWHLVAGSDPSVSPAAAVAGSVLVVESAGPDGPVRAPLAAGEEGLALLALWAADVAPHRGLMAPPPPDGATLDLLGAITDDVDADGRTDAVFAARLRVVGEDGALTHQSGEVLLRLADGRRAVVPVEVRDGAFPQLYAVPPSLAAGRPSLLEVAGCCDHLAARVWDLGGVPRPSARVEGTEDDELCLRPGTARRGPEVLRVRR